LGFTLDTGALIALQKRKRRAWQFVELAVADDLELRAPAAILTEFWRGPVKMKAPATLIESAISWIDVTPSLARRAGVALLDAGRGPSAVDALVATVAALHGDVVLTSDIEDFTRLANHYPGLRVLRV
jgi:predicted nucleic acid-binding protein